MKYITAAETNKLIRAQLSKLYPSTTFRVHLTSGGNSARVEWWDGPTMAEVKAITGHFEGATFDGMEDLESSVTGTHPDTGESVHFGTKYINEERRYSLAFLTNIAQQVCNERGQPMPTIDFSTAFGASIKDCVPGSLGYAILKQAQETSGLTKPSKPRTNKRALTQVSPTRWEVSGNTWPIKRKLRELADLQGGDWDREKKVWWFPERTPALLYLVDGQYHDPDEPLPPAAPGEPQAAHAETPAKRLHALADNMQAEIAHKLNPPIRSQNPTRRRASIAASMAQDGWHLKKVQARLHALADAWDAGSIPNILKGIRSRNLVDYLVRYDTAPGIHETIFKSAVKANMSHPDNYAKARRALLELGDSQAGQMTPAEQKRLKIQELEDQLIGLDIPGYFPTPKAIVERMVHLAGISGRGKRILEPSAGKGNIADVIAQQYPDHVLHCVEFANRLRDILIAKGHTLVGDDIFYYHVADEDRYDYVLMNPPFEHLADIDHVRYVYDHLLKPGGRLVAIMCESAFFRNDAKAVTFRKWLRTVGYDLGLPEDAFKASERPTGVRTRLVVIDKPLEEKMMNPFKQHYQVEGSPVTVTYTPAQEPVNEPASVAALEIEQKQALADDIKALEKQVVDLARQLAKAQAQLETRRAALAALVEGKEDEPA